MFFSCSTDLDINADYKNIPVVYSLLDKNSSVQYVKLNKSFIGDVSASEMAQNPDSLNYKDAVVKLIKYKNDVVVDVFSFVKTDTIEKEDGIFSNAENIIYVYNGYIINNNETINEVKFVLEIEIPGIDKITAETKLVSDVTILAPLGYITPKELGLYSTDYLIPSYKFASGENAKNFEYYLEVFYYEEIAGNFTLKKISSKQGSKTAKTLYGGESFDFSLDGESFYGLLQNNIKVNENVEKRIFYSLRYIFYSAGEDLSTYIDLTKPNYGIVQEKPAFTNINNGWGLFSSRTTTYSLYKKLNSNSMDYLPTGSYTKELKFLGYVATSNFYGNNRELDIDSLYIQLK